MAQSGKRGPEKKDMKDQIVQWLREHSLPFMGTGQLADKAGMSNPGITKHLKRAEKAGVIEKTEISGYNVWYLPEIKQRGGRDGNGRDGDRKPDQPIRDDSDGRDTRTRRVEHPFPPTLIFESSLPRLLKRLARATETVGMFALMSFVPAVLGFIPASVTFTLAVGMAAGWLIHLAGAMTLYVYEEFAAPTETPYHDNPKRLLWS